MENDQHMNSIGKISHFFTVNRPLSLLLLGTAVFFGLGSFYLTPKQYNPEIRRPAFAITLSYEGTTANQALDRVAYELVQKIETVPGVEDVYTEIEDGSTIVTTVMFKVGYDSTKAKVDLLSQLDQHRYLAQGFIHEPHVIEINPETIPVLQVVFDSETLPISKLREKVVSLSHTLSTIDNVSEIAVVGGYPQALVVEVDPTKLAAYSLTVEDVRLALMESQYRTVMNGIAYDSHQIEVTYDAQSNSPAEIGALEIHNGILVRDVAIVYEGHAGTRSYVLHKSTTDKEFHESIMLSVSKVEKSSAPNVTKQVLEKLEETIENESYRDVTYTVVSDDGKTASKEIYGLTKNLVSSIVIVAAVLFVFLSIRAALVVLVAIPVTLLVVFGLGYLFGETINRITLFALILSLGLLVDSAIVVVENIYSHIRKKDGTEESREKVIAGSVHEIGVGLLLSMVTSVIVFLPMRYITGMMGPYMGPIAFFVPAALIVSFFVAIIITPFIASYLIRANEKETKFNALVERGVGAITASYTRFLGSILREKKRQRFILFGTAGLFLLSIFLPLSGLVHFQMLPRADQNQFYVYVDLPEDTALEKTRFETVKVANLLSSDRVVESIQVFAGQPPILDFNGLFKGAQNRAHTYQATLRVNLIPAESRRESSSDIVSRFRKDLLERYPETAHHTRFLEEPPGPPVQATLVAKVFSKDEPLRTDVSKKLHALFGEVSGVVDRYVKDAEPVGRVSFILDQGAARERGVSAQSINRVVSLMYQPREVTEYVATESGEYSPMFLSLSPEYRKTAADIDLLSVRSADGSMVPVSSVVKTDYVLRPKTIYLEDASLVKYVTAEIEGRPVIYTVVDLIRKINAGGLPGYTIENWNLFRIELKNTAGENVTLKWGGEWKMTLENFRDLGIAMIIALLLVYAVLVGQYNRFATPAYILVTVPLGLIGILWGFFVLDTVFNVYLTATALIGFIALIGLVVNNAIIYLEYVEQALAEGADFEKALLAAGEVRLRPIALTSLTTIFGSLTIAGDPVWSGLAWAIVFGLSLSTIMTLVIYPTLLAYFTAKNYK